MAATLNSKRKKKIKNNLKVRDGERCAICGCSRPLHELTIDHIIPKCEEGTNVQENLRLACFRCNHGRHH